MATFLVDLIQGALLLGFAAMAIAFCLFVIVCLGMMVYSLYKGATDRTWR